MAQLVTGFEVRWQRDTSVGCSDEAEDTISETAAFHNSYQISGLEPGNRYTITVTVSNAAGTAPVSNSVTGTTLETGERESLLLLSELLSPQLPLVVQPHSHLVLSQPEASVQWEEVPCLHHNGEIAGYTVVARVGMTDNIGIVNNNVRSATISDLEPSTQYTVQQFAVNWG